MPLLLFDNSLTGIFQGQNNPVKIGKASERPDKNRFSPFVYGYYRGEDSIQMNAFFDPAASSMLGENPDYEKIGIIQTGRLQINHLYLPYDFYQVDSLYPDTVKYTNMFGASYPGASEWIDTPWEKSNGQVNIDPTFPAWNYADSARTPLKTMFQYPNNYGGYVRYRAKNPYNYSNGENLCAYIQSNLVINSGNSPYFPMKLDLMDFLDCIDPEFYSLEDTKIVSTNFKNHPEKVSEVVNQLHRHGIIPFNFDNNSSPISWFSKQKNLGTFITFLNSKVRYVVSPTRLYIEYYPGTFFPMENDEPERIVLIPMNGTFHYFNYVDDFEDDFNDARNQSGPDIEAIFKCIKAQYGFSVFKHKDLVIKHQMYTCACAISLDTKSPRAYIRLLEGFGWDISKQFQSATKRWNNLQLELEPTSTDRQCNYRRNALKFTLGNYYRKTTGNKDFVVEFV